MNAKNQALATLLVLADPQNLKTSFFSVGDQIPILVCAFSFVDSDDVNHQFLTKHALRKFRDHPTIDLEEGKNGHNASILPRSSLHLQPKRTNEITSWKIRSMVQCPQTTGEDMKIILPCIQSKHTVWKLSFLFLFLEQTSLNQC